MRETLVRTGVPILFVLLAACGFPKPAEDQPSEQDPQSFAADHPFGSQTGDQDESADSTTSQQVSTTLQVTGPDGTRHWLVVHCEASDQCYARASEVCPMGWSVYDKDKSTTYQVTGRSVSRTSSTSSGTATVIGNTAYASGEGSSVTVGTSSATALPIEHGEMLIKCGSEQNDAKLLDELKALCDGGNEKACRAHEFAVKKRGCCMWNQGARSCNDDHKVVCFDGHVSTCDC